MSSCFEQQYPDAQRILREMGEWMALGFYEGIDLPWPRAFGLGYRRLYENMRIGVPANRLLYPCEPFPIAPGYEREPGLDSWHWNRVGDKSHHATGFLCDFMHNCGIHKNRELITDNKLAFPQYATFIDDLMVDLQSRLYCDGDYTHSNPDMRRIVNDGFNAMERELDDQIAGIEAAGTVGSEAYNLMAALKDYTIGVRTFHSRVATALDAAVGGLSGTHESEMALIARNFKTAFLEPANNFIQGILAVNFAWMLDGCDSIGRVDQVLGELFDHDMQTGTLDISFARRLIDELFYNFERFGGWNLQIGGYRPDGNEGYNRLTYELILACDRNHLRLPNVAFRITKYTPLEALFEALKVLKEGSGRPALYNDDLYVSSLLSAELGITPEDARDLGFGGCTETMIPGMSNVGCIGLRSATMDCNDINLAKIVELALNDGYDPVRKKHVGPHTGRFEDFPDFEAFLAALQTQIRFVTGALITDSRPALEKRFQNGDPKLYRTFFTRDCVRKMKSFEAGGARYNWSVVNYAGIANLVDSLAAIRKCVFDDKTIAPKELILALAANFEGFEKARADLLAAPKLGNDNSFVDDMARDILGFAWRELRMYEHPRGGRYLPACLMFVTHGAQGVGVGATPDGRKAGTPLTDSAGPMTGRDTHGSTAMLKSMAKLPLSLALGTPVLNIRFQKQFIHTQTGLNACVDLIRTFFVMGGMQIQVSVLSKEEMLAAQKEPEKYADLIVRIGGYSEYFTKLDQTLQDSVIARTEHGEERHG